MKNSLHLLYHELRPAGSSYQYVTSCSQFQEHCALYAQLQGTTGDNLQPEVTFDDGHTSDLLHALPILLAHGLTARFFITAGWTSARAGYMTWAQLRELQQAGQTIGAHGMTHKLLTRCDAAELQEELAGARRRLEDGLGTAVTTMSLPGGRMNSRVLAACRQAGYTKVFTSVPRSSPVGTEPECVGRLNLTGGTTVAFLADLLTPSSGRLERIYRVHRVKAAAQTLLGDELYGRLWAVVNRHEAPKDVSAEAQTQ